MVEISAVFRAGWDATKEHMDGVANYADVDDERHLRAAWDAFCGTQTPPPHPLTPEAFVEGWNGMVATVSEFSARYNLPKPQMIFHPQWLSHMNKISDIRLAPVIIHMDVKIRFGMFEQVDALRLA